jgi:hypothetical protein
VLILLISIVGCTEDNSPTEPENPYQLEGISARSGSREQIGAYVGDGFFRVNVPAGGYLLSYKTEKFGVSHLVFRAETPTLINVNLTSEDQVIAASLRSGEVLDPQDSYATGPIRVYAWPGVLNGLTSPTWETIFQLSSSLAQMVIEYGRVYVESGTVELPESFENDSSGDDSSGDDSSGDDSSGDDSSEQEDEDGLVIHDLLSDGSSVGYVTGGMFTNEGYTVTTNSGGYLAYETDILHDIRIEFDAKGYVPLEENGDGKIVIMQMFDSGHDFNWMGTDPWFSPYSMYEVRKRGKWDGQVLDRTDGVHFKCGGEGNDGLELGTWIPGDSPAEHPLDWDSDTVYHWVITLNDSYTEISRNGKLLFAEHIGHVFSPDDTLNIRIGGTWFGRVGPANVTYSNVKIFRL